MHIKWRQVSKWPWFRSLPGIIYRHLGCPYLAELLPVFHTPTSWVCVLCNGLENKHVTVNSLLSFSVVAQTCLKTSDTLHLSDVSDMERTTYCVFNVFHAAGWLCSWPELSTIRARGTNELCFSAVLQFQ